MNVVRYDRGFEILVHEIYPPQAGATARLAQQSSIALEDCLDNPGSSALWIGQQHHLNREEVKALVAHLQHWLDTGYLDLSRTPAD